MIYLYTEEICGSASGAKKEFTVFKRGVDKANHSRWCEDNPKRSSYNKDLSYARSKIQNPGNQYTKNKDWKITEATRKKMSKASSGRTHSEASKLKLSAIKKEWLRNNPDQHPWKQKDKFQSVPCEVLKKKMRDMNIEFVEEFQLLTDRFFSIDIALPEKKIGIEVNGNQHYNKDKTLKKYYQERHDLIEENGWRLIELHYSECYNDNVINNLGLW